ncbi:MAG: type III ribulose-bisphosphate carboxylase [archaeon]|nr:type III ribulose-bisphosphate carboxylase [archaeon]
MSKYEYIDLKYRPGSTDLVAKYRLQPNGIPIEKACEHIAAESSIGTWTDVCTMSSRIKNKLKPHVYEIDRRAGTVKIAYARELFEDGNVAQILSSIAGNIFGMNAIKSLRLLDISFPRCMAAANKGPAFGISGVRKVTGVNKRPLVGTIIKPKVGLDSQGHANVAYNAWVGGLDIVKDDENLTSLVFNKFNERIRLTLRARDKAEVRTGERKFYMPNVTAETDEMLRRARFVKAHGGEYVMIDILTAGFSALQTLRGTDLGLVIHAHRAMHGAITRNPEHGISMLTVAKIARLIGVDQLHIGAIIGKMHGSGEEVLSIQEGVTGKVVKEDDKKDVLSQKWHGTKPVLPVASGGLHPGHVPGVVKYMGQDIVMQFGGGCHGHPKGTEAGARAIRQAVEMIVSGKKKLPEEYRELNEALSYWGK